MTIRYVREGELIYRRNADKPRFYGTSERYLVFGWCLNICNDNARKKTKHYSVYAYNHSGKPITIPLLA